MYVCAAGVCSVWWVEKSKSEPLESELQLWAPLADPVMQVDAENQTYLACGQEQQMFFSAKPVLQS